MTIIILFAFFEKKNCSLILNSLISAVLVLLSGHCDSQVGDSQVGDLQCAPRLVELWNPHQVAWIPSVLNEDAGIRALESESWNQDPPSTGFNRALKTIKAELLFEAAFKLKVSMPKNPL